MDATVDGTSLILRSGIYTYRLSLPAPPKGDISAIYRDTPDPADLPHVFEAMTDTDLASAWSITEELVRMGLVMESASHRPP